MKFTLFLLFIFLFSHSCSTDKPGQPYNQNTIDSLQSAFIEHTTAKDNEFKTADWSPLTAEDKIAFTGLKYFPYDPSFRFEGPIIKYTNPDSITILGSREGDVRSALKFGYFEFEKKDQKHRLEIIKILPRREGADEHLFLGFWDATSDLETYAGGRYLDIKENQKNHYIIDFNYAYNPYCAYSDRYSCAIPILESRLSIAITCGEKIFKKH